MQKNKGGQIIMARYTINNVQYPGSTTVLGLLDKSQALMGWATGCMEKYIDKRIHEENQLVEIGIQTVLNIVHDARFNYKEISQEAMGIGTEVHNMIEQYIKAVINKEEFDWKGKYKKEVENGYLAFLEWEKKNIVEYLECEQVVVSREYGYAGTLDLVAKLKNGLIYCIDFKASKGFYDGYKEQVASYKAARMEVQEDNELKILFKADDTEREYTIIQKPIKIDGIGVVRLDKETGVPEFEIDGKGDYTKDYDKAINSFRKLLVFYYAYKVRRLTNNPFVK